MASPRLSKYRTGESGGGDSGDSKGSDYSRKSGAGLSDYTSKRLEELRLRRAESAADSYQEYRAKREAREKEATSTTTNTSSTSGTDYLDLGRRSGGDSTSATTASSVTTTSTSLTSSPYNTSFGQDAIKTSKEGDTCIGFATLPDQIHRKAVKRGFDFTLMVVGESGLGKSTLISSMFLKDLYKDRQLYQVEERVAKTVEIDKNYLEIEEKGVKLRLTIVDTPGFNDSVNAMDCWRPIEEYINQQFDQYFKDESGLNRKNIKDNRVHVCLYFISPFGHGLRQIDVMFMKRLHEKVNIVPVIAKADTLTPKEIRRLKAKVLEQVEQYRIKVYEFPDCDSDEDEDFKQQDKELKQSTPFAVIGSNTIVEVNGRKVRGRLYPWGIVEVENPQHSDFGKLRQMLISTHMQDLKDVTRDIHYENYRAMYIKEQMTKNQRERGDIISKLKRDSSPNFEAMMETDALLHQKDEEIRRMHMMLAKMQEQLHSKGQGVNGLGNL